MQTSINKFVIIYRIPKNYNKESGIYYFISNENRKMYIGSTINFRKRFIEHRSLLKNKKHSNPHLQRHVNKYGLDVLIYDYLELCDIDTLEFDEQFYVNSLNPEFNIMKRCVVNRIGLSHTEETKRKMREAAKRPSRQKSYKKMAKINKKVHTGNEYNIGRKHSEETKRKISKKLTGRKMSEESKKKISESLTGVPKSEEHKKALSKSKMGNKHNLGNYHSEETKRKIALTHAKAVNQYDRNMNFIKEWESASEASRQLNINQSNISACTLNNRNIAGGYKWRKAHE